VRRAEAAGEGAGAARFRRLTMSDAVSSAPAWARIRHSSSLPSAAASWSGVRPCCGEGRWGEVSASGQWVWLRGGLTRCAPLSVARRRSASLGVARRRSAHRVCCPRAGSLAEERPRAPRHACPRCLVAGCPFQLRGGGAAATESVRFRGVSRRPADRRWAGNTAPPYHPSRGACHSPCPPPSGQPCGREGRRRCRASLPPPRGAGEPCRAAGR